MLNFPKFSVFISTLKCFSKLDASDCILAIQEAEIKRIIVQGHHEQIGSRDSIPKVSNTKNG
jgi:hypothetical protein